MSCQRSNSVIVSSDIQKNIEEFHRNDTVIAQQKIACHAKEKALLGSKKYSTFDVSQFSDLSLESMRSAIDAELGYYNFPEQKNAMLAMKKDFDSLQHCQYMMQFDYKNYRKLAEELEKKLRNNLPSINLIRKTSLAIYWTHYAKYSYFTELHNMYKEKESIRLRVLENNELYKKNYKKLLAQALQTTIQKHEQTLMHQEDVLAQSCASAILHKKNWHNVQQELQQCKERNLMGNQDFSVDTIATKSVQSVNKKKRKPGKNQRSKHKNKLELDNPTLESVQAEYVCAYTKGWKDFLADYEQCKKIQSRCVNSVELSVEDGMKFMRYNTASRILYEYHQVLVQSCTGEKKLDDLAQVVSKIKDLANLITGGEYHQHIAWYLYADKELHAMIANCYSLLDKQYYNCDIVVGLKKQRQQAIDNIDEVQIAMKNILASKLACIRELNCMAQEKVEKHLQDAKNKEIAKLQNDFEQLKRASKIYKDCLQNFESQLLNADIYAMIYDLHKQNGGILNTDRVASKIDTSTWNAQHCQADQLTDMMRDIQNLLDTCAHDDCNTYSQEGIITVETITKKMEEVFAVIGINQNDTLMLRGFFLEQVREAALYGVCDLDNLEFYWHNVFKENPIISQHNYSQAQINDLVKVQILLAHFFMKKK